MELPILLVAIQVLGIGALLYAQAKHYDKVVAHLEGLARGGVVVSMDKHDPIKVDTQALTMGQKRRLLEAAARKRAAEKVAA